MNLSISTTLILLSTLSSQTASDNIDDVFIYPSKATALEPRECSSALKEFAESASNFTLCSIRNARPIHMCEHCITHYLNFKEKYVAAMEHPYNTSGSTNITCKSFLIHKDKLEVLLNYYNNILNVWNNAHCDACYDWSNKIPITSNATLHFYQKFNITKDCINNNIFSNMSNSEKVCKMCMQNYIDLDEYYESLIKGKSDLDSVCMDIIDSMNNTRIVWSNILNCCKLRRHPEIIFLACTGVLAALPLLFYIILRYFGTMRDLPRVLKQTRFKERFLAAIQTRRMSTSR